MPNLMLTNYCNYHCPYCFGMDMMAPKKQRSTMTRETFTGIIDWLEREPFDRVIHLMGGEPTLHPDIEWIVDYLLERDLHITIFSNMATKQAVSLAEKISFLPIYWVANVNNPAKWTPAQRDNIEHALKAAGKRASLTFNIIPEEPNELWALDLIERFDLDRNIKVGFVLPTLTSSNMALKDTEYGIVAQRVVDLVKAGEYMDVSIKYECGVPYCSFTDEQLGYLWRHNSKISSGCQSRLDITPEGEVMYCLPLATAGLRHYTEFKSYPECRTWFENRFRPYRMLGNRIECADCMLNNPIACNGACLAKNMIGANNVQIVDK
ncbi:MAG: radical SAM protein [Prevotella sp.]|nr:radical SAM protein [Prevotella sp.]